jgi:outer membrane protein TolC
MKHFLKIILLVAVFQCSVIAQQSLTLEETFEIAKQNSPDIKQAQINLERSRELLNAQEASLRSRFSLTLEPFNYSRDRQFNTFFSTWNTSELKSSSALFTIAQPILFSDGTLVLRNQFGWRDSFSEFLETSSKTFSNNLYLSYDQPIFTYNRTRLALRDVELDLENAAINYQIQELALERLVAQGFYAAYQNKMNLQVSEEEYENRKQIYQIINNKVDAGLAAQEELYQAELDLTSSESQVQNQKVLLENSLDDFKRLLGLPVMEDITVAADISMVTVEVDLARAMDFGTKNRYELRQRKIDIEAAQTNLVRSAATNEFKGNISLTYGIIGNDEKLSQIYNVPTQNQRVNLSFEVPIWDWGEQASRTRAAEATVQSRELSFEEEEKSIKIAIRKVYRSLQNQALQVELARQNVKMAQLTYDINLERYENGDLTSMDLNLFQNQLSQKKIGLVTAMINYKIDLLDLKIESLWDFEKDRPAIDINNKM